MNFRYRMTNSIYEGDMNASICSRYHEQFFTICTILSFEISIDTDYPPFNTARWILLLKRRSRKKTLKSIIVPSKFNSILHTSTFLIYIFQTIATSIQKYNLSNNQKKIIFTRAIIFSQLSIYLSICSKTKLFEFFEHMQRLSAYDLRRATFARNVVRSRPRTRRRDELERCHSKGTDELFQYHPADYRTVI